MQLFVKEIVKGKGKLGIMSAAWNSRAGTDTDGLFPQGNIDITAFVGEAVKGCIQARWNSGTVKDDVDAFSTRGFAQNVADLD